MGNGYTAAPADVNDSPAQQPVQQPNEGIRGAIDDAWGRPGPAAPGTPSENISPARTTDTSADTANAILGHVEIVVPATVQQQTQLLESTANSAFSAELDRQSNEIMNGTIVGAINGAFNVLKTGIDIASSDPVYHAEKFAQDYLEYEFGNPANQAIAANNVREDLANLASDSDKAQQALAKGYEPVDQHLMHVGDKYDHNPMDPRVYAQLTADSLNFAVQVINDFSNQAPGKQAHDFMENLTQFILTDGIGHAASAASGGLKEAQLLEKAAEKLKSAESLLPQTLEPAADGVVFKKYVFNGEKDQLTAPKAAERLNMKPKELKELDDKQLEALGVQKVEEYRKTFFQGHPDLVGFEDEIVVHHAIEQQVLEEYPGLFTAKEINDLGNLRGIPADLNDDLHNSLIRKAWDKFYRTHPPATTTRQQVIQYANQVDSMYGNEFVPPV